MPDSATGRADQFDLVAPDIRSLRRWIGGHLVAPAGSLAPLDLSLLEEVAQWNVEGAGTGDQSRLAAAVGRALRAAATVPGGAPVLVLYLKALCDEAWEASWQVDVIFDVVRAVNREWVAVEQAGPTADPELTRLVLQLLDVLTSEVETLNAGSCGAVAGWADRAAETRDRAAAVLTSAVRQDSSPLADWIAAEARADTAYYAALASAGRAVTRYFQAGIGDGLADAVAALGAAEVDLPDGCERGELRAHRFNLRALAKVASQPWLRLDHARVVYLYPFGLYADATGQAVSGPAPETDSGGAGWTGPGGAGQWSGDATFAATMVDVARRTAGGWTVAGRVLADQPGVEVARELRLDDIWRGEDPLGRQYRGIAIRLPDLELVDVDRPAAPPLRMEIELRLSELGNHYLRMECELVDADPTRVYAALLRAAPEFGDLVRLGTPLRATGTERAWPRLSDYANEVGTEVAGRLAEHSGLDVRCSGRPGMYHVLVSVDQASLISGTGSVLPVESSGELTAAVGAQPLCHPVRHGISSLAEWARYPVELADLTVDVPGFDGDLLLRTCNTTIVFEPGTPEYMIGTVEEAAEFVATLEGMFAGWQDQLAAYHEQLNGQLVGMIRRLDGGEADPEPTADGLARYERTTQELVEIQSRLEAQQLRLHQFVTASRLSLMFVTSPSLVASPVIRVTIDRLLSTAKFDVLRTEFEGMVDRVLGDRIRALVDASVRRQRERAEAYARAVRDQQVQAEQAERDRREYEARVHAARDAAAAYRQERRERANRRRNDVLLGSIAAMGLSGLISILQAGYEIKKAAASWLAVLVLLMAVAVGWILHRTHPDSGADPARPDVVPPLAGLPESATAPVQAGSPVPTGKRPG